MYKKIYLLSIALINFISIKTTDNLPDDELTKYYMREIKSYWEKKSEFLEKIKEISSQRDAKKITDNEYSAKITEYSKQASHYGLEAVYLSIKLKQYTAQQINLKATENRENILYDFDSLPNK